ncbi:uncharacterized protein IWZ02DRAFT_282876 [Phyllosticta citriasiana]|uniref:uncharacterized protein n=1 Tax=Phyllosticta citriasiana TaxID=595635 RepID=UPI0030FD73BC
MHYLKKPPPTPVCAPPPRSRPLRPLSNNEVLALWTQASYLFHHLNWTSSALLVARILRRTWDDDTSHILRAKLWANLGIVRFHLGDYSLALEAIEEALDEVSVSMGLKPGVVDDEDVRGGVAVRIRPGRVRSAATTFSDFIRAGAASFRSPGRRSKSEQNATAVLEPQGADRVQNEEEMTPPRRVGKAATVANSITTMGRFIRAGAVWSVGNSSISGRGRIGAGKGDRKTTRNMSFRATQATPYEGPEANSLRNAEGTGPAATTTEAGKTRVWRFQARSGQTCSRQKSAKEKHRATPCPPRPLTPVQAPLPFPPETPLLFFLAGLVAYHLPTTPRSPINYFRVAHAYFKRCLGALSLLSHATTARAPGDQHPIPSIADLVAHYDADNDDETNDYEYAGEYVDEVLEDEQEDEQATSFDFSPYGFAFVLSRRSIITNALTCDYEAECVEGRGTLVVGRCRGVDGVGAGVEGVWFEAPLGDSLAGPSDVASAAVG